jgi:hypothetical protein
MPLLKRSVRTAAHRRTGLLGSEQWAKQTLQTAPVACPSTSNSVDLNSLEALLQTFEPVVDVADLHFQADCVAMKIVEVFAETYLTVSEIFQAPVHRIEPGLNRF